MIGLEIRLKWASLVDQRLREQGLGERARVRRRRASRGHALHGRIYHGRAPQFPDPWWKKRHEKRIVLGDGLLGEIVRVLVPGGAMFIQTDVAERADMYEALFKARPEFSFSGPTPRIEHNPFGARSRANTARSRTACRFIVCATSVAENVHGFADGNPVAIREPRTRVHWLPRR